MTVLRVGHSCPWPLWVLVAVVVEVVSSSVLVVRVVEDPMVADRKDTECRDRWGLFRSCHWNPLGVVWIANRQLWVANRRRSARQVGEGSLKFR